MYSGHRLSNKGSSVLGSTQTPRSELQPLARKSTIQSFLTTLYGLNQPFHEKELFYCEQMCLHPPPATRIVSTSANKFLRCHFITSFSTDTGLTHYSPHLPPLSLSSGIGELSLPEKGIRYLTAASLFNAQLAQEIVERPEKYYLHCTCF